MVVCVCVCGVIVTIVINLDLRIISLIMLHICICDDYIPSLLLILTAVCILLITFLQCVVVLLLSAADVLSEGAILKWYNDGKGKAVLLEQLKPFVEWLKHAEEGRLNVPNVDFLPAFYLTAISAVHVS